MPVTLHLNLAELSGKIRFCVTPAISVHNQVGKGEHEFNEFPQLSEIIVKKIKAFVHNKIVYWRLLFNLS